MADQVFVANEDFFATLGKASGVVALCKKAADGIASAARASAPVETGRYQSMIGVDRQDTEYRCVFRVEANADHSMAVEARTGNLVRALRGYRG